MRVLLLSTGGKIGGEETFTRNLASGLIERGHEVEVAVGGPVQEQDLRRAGIAVAEVDISGRTPVALLRAARNLARCVADKRFDVVHAQAVGPAVMGVLAKRFYGCRTPWIWHNHGITDFAYRYVVRWLNGLDRIVANSDYVAEMLKGHGVKPGKIRRIHNGIDVRAFSVSGSEREAARAALRKEFSIPVAHRIVLYVGRLSPEKGVEVLLDAFRALAETTGDVSCLLVGDGAQRGELLRRIEPWPCRDRIVFAGFRKDIRELMAGSDIFVLPSHLETFSLSTLQAFAVGIPCVASDVGGTPEQILHKFNGLLFGDGRPDELAARLGELLGDTVRSGYLSDNAMALSRSYLNGDRMIDEIECLYNRLIADKG